MRFYTASKLGSKRSYTPEGFLVCLDVPIARTGEMLYVAGEIPGLIPGKDGLIRVQREASEVFKPRAMASFVGKPTTNDHPPEFVTPANFRRYACGAAANVRQGTGDQSDLLLADLLWSDPVAIKAIEGGKDEISLGYDAEYDQIAPGQAVQHSIVGNHVALVDDGRCGERCSIGDSAAALHATAAAETAASSQDGAGVALKNAAGELLFLQRAEGGDHPGEWCFPGGSIDGGETAEIAARRELMEETGLEAGALHQIGKRVDRNGSFTTFIGDGSGSPTPTLNGEHTTFRWARAVDAPQPLHPGVAATIAECPALSSPPANPALDSAPSCRCGGHTHHRDAIAPAAKPARNRKRKTRDMSTKPVKVRASMLDRLRRSFQSKDEAGFEEAMNAVEEATAEEEAAEEQAALANTIAEAVTAAIAPVVERLDAVETFTADLKKTRDDEAAAAQTEAEKGAAEKAAAEKAAAESGEGTKDNEALAAFLKAKGLSDEDVAEACKMLGDETKDELETGGGLVHEGESDPATSSGDPDAGANRSSLQRRWRPG